jgi:exopolysaccharide biosynthesis protein
MEGIYPHNMVGISEDGKLLSVVTRGLSNRVGLTIRGAASLMAQLGARDALLLDNGADVMMSFDGATRLGSRDAEQSRLRSILIYCNRADERLDLADARLIVYPEQLPTHQSGPFWA